MIQKSNFLKYKGKIVFHKLTVPIPQRELKPFTNGEACFMFVNQGDFTVRTPDELIPFKKGKGLLAKCFNFFIESTKTQRTQCENMEVVGVFLFPEIVEELLHIDLSQSEYNVNYNIKKIQIDRLLDNFKESISIYLDNPDLADEETIGTKIKEFILLMVKMQDGLSQLDFLSGMFRTNSTDFRTLVSNNVYSNMNIEEYAQLSGMSKSSFKRKFEKIYNVSPRKYLEKMKLTKAAELLLTTEQRISEIAYDCGFETISTFNRSFKTSFNISPSEYRLNQIE
ncbi:MAG: AraC-like DNA-binding protein [Crocinitomix sp.]|jgi:AraC-like DNA-binding protein